MNGLALVQLASDARSAKIPSRRSATLQGFNSESRAAETCKPSNLFTHSRVVPSTDRLAAEHAGMAEELLCVYEQLGVVFEVTRRLHTVRKESEVVDLFLESLRRSFQGHEVFFVSPPVPSCPSPQCGPGSGADTAPRGNPAWRPPTPLEGSKRSLPDGVVPDSAASGAWFADWLGALVERARQTRKAHVERTPDSGSAVPGAVAEVMVAPVFAGPVYPGATEPSTGAGGGPEVVSGEGDSFVGAILLSRLGPDVRGERAEMGAPTHIGGHKEWVRAEAFRASDMLLLESLATFCGDLIRNHRLVGQLRDMAFAMVRSMVGAVEQKDTYTSGHSVRVGYFATMLGKALGLDVAALTMIQWGALLHDVGKIGIRDDVLKKEGRLTEDEFRHIREHPVRSHQMVRDMPELAGALDGILHHHERYDGSGYPSGLCGEKIPLAARIIQIADVFDALTSTRSYRPAFSWERALEILKEEAGKTVDPRLATVFDECIRAQTSGDAEGWNKLLRRANAFTQSALLAGADPFGFEPEG